METRIASTARADLADMEDAAWGTARMSARMGWAGDCMITYACATERVRGVVAVILMRPVPCEPGARHLYRAGWGQSVRTEHHLAHPRGSARWCFGLELCLT
jgi:hypothetical protein